MIYVILYYGMGWLLLPCHGVNDKNDKYETSVFLWINQMSPLPLCIEWDFIQNRWFHKFHIRSGLFLYFLASAEDLCVECSTKDPMATFSEYKQFYSIPVTRVNKDYLRSVIQQNQAILSHALHTGCFFLTGSAQKVISMELVLPTSKRRPSTLVPPNTLRMAKI